MSVERDRRRQSADDGARWCNAGCRRSAVCQQLRISWRNRRRWPSESQATEPMTKHYLIVGSVTMCVSVVASAQIPPKPTPIPTRAAPSSLTAPPDSTNGTAAGCPGGNGIHISATGGTVSDSASGTNQFIGLGQSVDTTWVFNISQRTWTRTNLAAAISVGLADEVRGRYSICAGVTALMPSATLTLQGARGRVHFAASLKDLSAALRLGPGR